MINADIAMVIIFVLGIIGTIIEPWSPHPLMMLKVGLLYFCVRFTAPIIVTKVMSRKETK